MEKRIHLEASGSELLPATWRLHAPGFPVVRGSALISAEQTAILFDYLEKHFPQSRRWVVLQLAMPDTEWPAITSESFYLEGKWTPHLVMPMPLASPPEGEEERSDLQWRAIWRFIQQSNSEGWLFLSEWLDDEMERAVHKFYKDAAEEFHVEATLKDFHHEITSFLLRDYRVNCAKLVLQLGQSSLDGKIDPQQGHVLEVEIVRLHFEILRSLGIQRDILIKIGEAIAKVERLHPELTSLKLAARLLAAILGPPLSLIQELLLLGLFCHHLDVGVYLHCNDSVDRTNLGLSILLAIKTLASSHSMNEMLWLVENYPQDTALKNEFIKTVWEYIQEIGTMPSLGPSPPRLWMPSRERIDVILAGAEQKGV